MPFKNHSFHTKDNFLISTVIKACLMLLIKLPISRIFFVIQASEPTVTTSVDAVDSPPGNHQEPVASAEVGWSTAASACTHLGSTTNCSAVPSDWFQ